MSEAVRPGSAADPVGGHARRPDSPAVLSRRRFLNRITLAMSGLIGLVLSVPILAYLLSPLLNRAPASWVRVGRADQFPVGRTVQVAFEDPSPAAWAGQTARTSAWLRRTGEASFAAFAVNCTHLACPVNWLQDAGLFLCPCHGGVFYADGSVAGGPPPRPLHRYEVRVVDGEVQLLAGAIPIGGASAG
jgi:menaquinol-cytochrome c reductase iron-sulfur subunit